MEMEQKRAELEAQRQHLKEIIRIEDLERNIVKESEQQAEFQNKKAEVQNKQALMHMQNERNKLEEQKRMLDEWQQGQNARAREEMTRNQRELEEKIEYLKEKQIQQKEDQFNRLNELREINKAQLQLEIENKQRHTNNSNDQINSII